jgi:XTP/dITP diphosphohydrolase
MRKILIATHNPAKREEITNYLSKLNIEFVTLDDFGDIKAVEETGKTFEENAILKAKYYAEKSGLYALADDGGLEIDFLNGEPGVKSRRWIGGRETSDEELVKYTIKRMKGVPPKKRGAQLRNVVALSAPGRVMGIFEASIRGIIAEKPSTSPMKKGFPFRQVLYIPKLKKYYNQDEMTPEEYITYNHRIHALEKLKPWLYAMS